MDEFYNANNRTWQMYLNIVKMYNYSLFANGLLMVTEEPEIVPTEISFAEGDSVTIKVGETLDLHVITNPAQANKTISYTSSATSKATVEAGSNNKVAVVTGVATGSSTITATCGSVTKTISVTVESAS